MTDTRRYEDLSTDHGEREGRPSDLVADDLPEVDLGEQPEPDDQALLEEIRYDELGMNLSATFADYLMPTMDSVPMIEVKHIETPNPNTPRGIKGMAEGPVQGAIACVALAVQDALARAGGRVDQLPLTPSRVLGALRAGKAPKQVS